jgi:hypothetical protein
MWSVHLCRSLSLSLSLSVSFSYHVDRVHCMSATRNITRETVVCTSRMRTLFFGCLCGCVCVFYVLKRTYTAHGRGRVGERDRVHDSPETAADGRKRRVANVAAQEAFGPSR